jgi:hypothetical protein
MPQKRDTDSSQAERRKALNTAASNKAFAASMAKLRKGGQPRTSGNAGRAIPEKFTPAEGGHGFQGRKRAMPTKTQAKKSAR